MRLTLPFIGLLLLLLLSACRRESAAELADNPTPSRPLMTATELPDMGPAPEILNDTWLNAEEPYTLASQRGKVVLLKFWTFG